MNPQIQNKEAMLKESIKHFLTSYQSGSTDYSSFESIFFRLIQTMLDPPLEITWFYSAVTYHAAKLSSRNNPSTRVLIAKDLLNLLISCSNLSSPLKKIGMLAPVVYELYDIVRDSRSSGLCVDMEVEKLVENTVSCVMMSARVYGYANEDAKFDSALVCFEDLVRVWTIDRGGRGCKFGENLRVFFPLSSDGIWKGLNGRCGIGELVGIVLCEVFFLRLYLSFGSGMSTEDFLERTKDQAVQTIKGFQNRYFLDMLLKMLLEPTLPLAALLSSEEEILLHKVLFDAVLLVEYSFYPGQWVQSCDSRSKKLAMLWVLVSERAIQFARDKIDLSRASLYLNAFRESQFVAELIKWASIEATRINQMTIPDVQTPKALIKWLLVLEHQGIRVFEHKVVSRHAKALVGMPIVESEPPLNQNILVRNEIDLNEDQEMDDLSNGGFPATFCLMGKTIEMGRKRKEVVSVLQESRIKQVKLELFGSSDDETVLPLSMDNGLQSGGAAENVGPDDDMELNG
ncbi:hypothetical protein ACP275_01G014800 [Erythranthe tilingii]